MTIKCFLLIRMANLQLYYIVLHLQTIKLKNRECGRLKAAWQKWWTVVILVAATCCTQWKNATIYSICFIFHVHIKMKDWVQNLAGVFFKWQNIVVKPVLKKELYASRIRGISQSSYITIRIEQLADDLHNVFFFNTGSTTTSLSFNKGLPPGNEQFWWLLHNVCLLV